MHNKDHGRTNKIYMKEIRNINKIITFINLIFMNITVILKLIEKIYQNKFESTIRGTCIYIIKLSSYN